MFDLNRFCCICLNKRKNLEKLLTIHDNSLSCHGKLTVLIPEMDIDDIKEMVYMCEECRACVDRLYNFRNTCLGNNAVLWKCIRKICLDKNSNRLDSIVLNELNEVDIRGYVDDDKTLRGDPGDDRTGVCSTAYIYNKDGFEIYNNDISDDDSIDLENASDNDDTNVNVNKSPENTTRANDSMNDIFCTLGARPENNKIRTDSNNLRGTEEKIFKCECNKIFTYNSKSSTVNVDDTILVAPAIHKCSVCDKIFSTAVGLAQHRRTHTGAKPFQCKTCQKSFTAIGDLNKHTRIHTGEKPYRCETCDKSFRYTSQLKTHVEKHIGDKSYKCDACDESFVLKTQLDHHSKSHKEKIYKCEKCDKAFAVETDLKHHSKTHSGEKPFKCETCDKRFAKNDCLKKHVELHVKKPFSCQLCYKSLATQIDLKRHLIRHVGGKPYSCEICDKSFVKQYLLKLHSQVHSDEKLFKCTVCPKSFSKTCYLKKHNLIHAADGTAIQ